MPAPTVDQIAQLTNDQAISIAEEWRRRCKSDNYMAGREALAGAMDPPARLFDDPVLNQLEDAARLWAARHWLIPLDKVVGGPRSQARYALVSGVRWSHLAHAYPDRLTEPQRTALTAAWESRGTPARARAGGNADGMSPPTT